MSQPQPMFWWCGHFDLPDRTLDKTEKHKTKTSFCKSSFGVTERALPPVVWTWYDADRTSNFWRFHLLSVSSNFLRSISQPNGCPGLLLAITFRPLYILVAYSFCSSPHKSSDSFHKAVGTTLSHPQTALVPFFIHFFKLIFYLPASASPPPPHSQRSTTLAQLNHW